MKGFSRHSFRVMAVIRHGLISIGVRLEACFVLRWKSVKYPPPEDQTVDFVTYARVTY